MAIESSIEELRNFLAIEEVKNFLAIKSEIDELRNLLAMIECLKFGNQPIWMYHSLLNDRSTNDVRWHN